VTDDTFDERELLDEIDREIERQAAASRHHLCFTPCPKQAYYIKKARTAGIQWKDIMDFCKKQGWSGSESTMLKWLRAQGGE